MKVLADSQAQFQQSTSARQTRLEEKLDVFSVDNVVIKYQLDVILALIVKYQYDNVKKGEKVIQEKCRVEKIQSKKDDTEEWRR